MHVTKTSFFGNTNIGMNVFANDNFALVSSSLSEEYVELIEKILQVPTFKTNICGTDLVGIFVAGDNNTLFVPELTFPHERAVLDTLPIKVVYVPTVHTALGNTIVYKDGTLIANDEFEQTAIEAMQTQAAVTTVIRTVIADTTVVGSCLCITSTGGVVHPEIDDDTLSQLETALHIKITRGTINQGSPYVRSGLIANKNGFLAGDTSAGPEITNADEAFGFVNID